jgi:hypothetical protein
MGTANIPRDFSEFLRLIEEEKVEYLLVGGYAVGYHGYPRATVDLDVWIAVSEANASKMVTVLRRFGMETPDLSPALFLDKGKIIRMGHPPVRVEIHTELSGVEFGECYENRLRTEFGGVEVNVINIADLKANKRAAGRHKDLDDLEHLP